VRVVVVSGIWPPDVGGPASHGPELARHLLARGHAVEAVVTADRQPAPELFPVRWVDRSLPKGVVHVAGALAVARAGRRADVVYSTGMFARSAAASAAVRRPYVVKLTGDPAFERARARAVIGGTVETFQHDASSVQVQALRLLRDATVRGARHVVVPSAFLRDLALEWGVRPERITVVPNATPAVELDGIDRDALRESFGIDGPTVAFAGRFGPQKSLDVLAAAVARVEGLTLLVAGAGDSPPHAGERVRLLGPLSRRRTLELFAAADATVLASTWENFPHSVVESLSVGTPVVATAVGGVPEVVEDGRNGLLVPPADPDALADALRRYVDDAKLQTSLRAAAAASVERFRPEHVYATLESILAAAAR
jgi:glycosyltransferase involved in cell wall biosynthesis